MKSGRPSTPPVYSRQLALLLALLASRPCLAQTVDPNLWVTNGTVRTVAYDEGTIYIGGEFTQVGAATGGAVPIDAATGVALGMPKVAGSVSAVAPDGAGGWFVGGSFTHVGRVPRSNLAHIKADHTVSSWAVDVDRPVLTLALSGNTLYVGGTFTAVRGQAREGIAALDATTGALNAWNPGTHHPFLYPRVEAIAVSGGTVYVGGWFETVGGQPRNHLAAVDSVTGLVTAWNPNVIGHYYPTVTALAVVGNTIFAAGRFDSLGGQRRNNLAAVDIDSGLPTSWNPSADYDVYDMVVAGNTVYVGGDFGHIGGVGRYGLAALDAVSGFALPWNPQILGTVTFGAIEALAVSGSTVFAGGQFTSAGGQARNNLVALDAATGLATSWNPNPSNPVYCLAAKGDIVYAGGAFRTIGGQTRNHLAALDAATGSPTSWNPDANGPVNTLTVSGGIVYAGGEFQQVGGQPRSMLASLDASTGLATAWDPNAARNYLSVGTVAVNGSTVYVGGSFSALGGQPRNGLAALDAVTGLATPWNPNPNTGVVALATRGSTVYVGGNFTSIGGRARSYLAAIDSSSGNASAWEPNAEEPVMAIAVRGDTLFVGGTHGSLPHGYVMAIDAETPSPFLWRAEVGYLVRALAVSGPNLYVGGFFGSIRGQLRNHLAALDAETGFVNTWNPDPDGQVRGVAVGGGRVFIAGEFGSIAGLPQSGIASIEEATPNQLVMSISHVTPGHATNAGPASLIIRGAGFQPGATAWLSLLGGAEIAGSGVSVAADGKALSATFDLTYVAPGYGDVTVTNPDLRSVTLRDGFLVIAGPPTITHVSPDRAVNAGGVTVVITGAAFDAPVSAFLRRSGQTIVGNPVYVESGGVTLSATFDLTGATPGAWDVVVANVDSQSDTLSGAFLVEAAAEGPTPVSFEIAAPNPAVDVARVWVGLPSADPATLEVMDLTGRVLLRREVSGLGAGRHLVDLTEAVPRPGLYVVRVRQAGREIQKRLTVLH